MAEMSSYLKDIQIVCQQDLPWDKLSGSKILVVGATGLIGSCLVDILMSYPRRDYDVYAAGRNQERALNRFAAYAANSSFHFLKCDVTEPLQGDTQFDYIIDAASNASPNFFANYPVEVMNANINGVANLLDYGMKHGMNRFLFVSTGEVYGEWGNEVKDEKSYGFIDVLNPRSCYPSSKRAAETLAMCYAAEYGVDVVIGRPCHTYGPFFTESDNRAYAQFIRNALAGEDIVLKSTGLQYRSWCYVVDCASALLHFLLKGETGQAYNVADNTSNVTIKALAEMIAGIGGVQVTSKEPTEEELRGFSTIQRAVFDTAKLESLGWHVIPGTMRDKLEHTIATQRLFVNDK